MVDSQKENFFKLLYSKNSTNIKLAIQIAEGNPNVKEILSDWIKVYQQIFPTKEAYTIEKVIRFFLGNLGCIQISNEPIERIPEKFFDIISKARLLTISRTNLKEIPAAIKKMKNLRHLHIVHCPIETLPSQLFKLTELHTLSIGNTNLSSISDEIGNLKKLEILSLPYNQIEKIPSEIKKLHELDSLILTKNQIKKIPKAINSKNLSNLRQFVLIKNPIVPRRVDKVKKRFQHIDVKF